MLVCFDQIVLSMQQTQIRAHSVYEMISVGAYESYSESSGGGGH